MCTACYLKYIVLLCICTVTYHLMYCSLMFLFIVSLGKRKEMTNPGNGEISVIAVF